MISEPPSKNEFQTQFNSIFFIFRGHLIILQINSLDLLNVVFIENLVVRLKHPLYFYKQHNIYTSHIVSIYT